MKAWQTVFFILAAAAIAECSPTQSGAFVPPNLGTLASRTAAQMPSRLCAPPAIGFFRCFALAVTARTTIAGLTPEDLQDAYRFQSVRLGRGATIAIVDAYDDPRAERDLRVYRAAFGLRACTTANGCFRKFNEWGEPRNYPREDRGWAGEISLDLDMVSAVCPNCRILLIEAASSSVPDLGIAVERAATLGAEVISNSYGGLEYAPYDKHFDRAGKAIVVAGTGDSGYFPQQPASFATVVAVGGTSLFRAHNARGWDEVVWNDADIGATGSGCSDFVTKPRWQRDAGCPTRAEADVAAVADPLTGVAVYDSLPVATGRPKGWLTMGGTSVATPIVAAAYALAGNARSVAAHYAESIYAAGGTAALNNVTQGSNGSCPAVYAYICNAGAGYNGPTGWGTPNGVAAF